MSEDKKIVILAGSVIGGAATRKALAYALIAGKMITATPVRQSPPWQQHRSKKQRRQHCK